MNKLIADILRNPQYIDHILNKLPPAFEMVGQQAKGPEVGTLREGVVIGMFIAFLGDHAVQSVASAVEPDIDCYIGDQPLSIKTVTGNGGIRLKWTSNADLAMASMRTYIPSSDLLIIQINWDDEGHIFYIPTEVQHDVFTKLGNHYLDYRANTNTRGFNMSRGAFESVTHDSGTIVLPVSWFRSIKPQGQYEPWVKYWRDP